MGFPDRIERTVRIPQSQEKVWAAVTTAEGLASWFGDTAEIDLRVGGAASMTFGADHVARMRVERLEPESVFGFTWGVYGLPDDDPRRTYVEFTLAAVDGGTTVTVVETGFAQLPDGVYGVAYKGNVGGWQSELDELVAYLGG